MLACARIGAIHSVVFGGFAAASLATRIDDARPEADGHRRRRHARRQGRSRTSRWSTKRCGIARHPPRRVIIVNRGLDRDLDVHAGPRRRLRDAARRSTQARACRANGSNRPSRRTSCSRPARPAQPKGVQRDTGGYAVALASSMRRIFCLAAGETMFCTSDIGWVVGPFVHRLRTADQRLDDDHVRRACRSAPMPASGGRSSNEHKVKTMFSSPTAIRVLKKQDVAFMTPPRPLVAALPVPRRRAARRADGALGVGRARRGDRRQLLADRIGLADPVRAARRRGHAAQVRHRRRFPSTATTSSSSTSATGARRRAPARRAC